MGFKCGIVGLPNVGKSTLFNALTQAGIESANYPFCTIEPNIGVVPVNDIRLGQLAKIVKNEPINPHSSPIVQKIKSVLCSGTKLNFVCVPFKNPLPNKPPEPIAIFD